jgi:hypothetical protein
MTRPWIESISRIRPNVAARNYAAHCGAGTKAAAALGQGLSAHVGFLHARGSGPVRGTEVHRTESGFMRTKKDPRFEFDVTPCGFREAADPRPAGRCSRPSAPGVERRQLGATSRTGCGQRRPGGSG